MATRLRQIVHVAPQQVELRETDAPDEALEPSQLLGDVLVTLVSPGTELNHHYLGKTFPSISGYASVSRVRAVGTQVSRFAPGDLIFGPAKHQSIARYDQGDVARIPEGLMPEHAVVARLMQVSMTSLMTTQARPGERVFIAGCGPVGYLAAEVFRISGYQVHVIEPHASRYELAKQAGHVVHARFPVDDPELAGTGALVLDCTGHEDAVIEGMRMARKGGEVVLVGVPWKQRSDATAHAVLHAVFHRYIRLRSGWEWELPREPGNFRPLSIQHTVQTALRWLADGQVKLDGVVSLHDPSDCQAVYQGHLHQTHPSLCTVFRWQ